MTTSAPEPASGDPDPRGDALRLRASDADRERVAEFLRDAYAEGRLTSDEYQSRLEENFAAQTYGDLVPVLRDLPVPPDAVPMPGVSVPAAVEPPEMSLLPGRTEADLVFDPHAGPAPEMSLVAIFGSFERRGTWTAPADIGAYCVFGGGDIDFTGATLTSSTTTINVLCLFGGLKVYVPAGMDVRSEAAGIFGGVEVAGGQSRPGAPQLVIKGAAIFGGIEVKRA